MVLWPGVALVEFLYTHPPFKIATFQSNCSGLENCIEVHATDIPRGGRVFTIELYNKVRGGNTKDYLPRVMLSTIFLLLY